MVKQTEPCLGYFCTWHFKISFEEMGQSIQKNGVSKICGRQPLKSLKEYGLLKQTISLPIF